MTRSAQVRLAWADGEYAFRLAIGELDELDELTGAGPGYMLALLQAGLNANWKAKWVREAIRIGLIGGGTDPAKALRLVKRYVDDRPLSENLLTAQAILAASVVGAEDDPVPERSGEGTPAGVSSPEAGSGSASSTSAERRSVTPELLSELAASGSLPTGLTAGLKPTRRPKG